MLTPVDESLTDACYDRLFFTGVIRFVAIGDVRCVYFTDSAVWRWNVTLESALGVVVRSSVCPRRKIRHARPLDRYRGGSVAEVGLYRDHAEQRAATGSTYGRHVGAHAAPS